MTAADKPWNQPVTEILEEEMNAEAPNPPGYDDAASSGKTFACIFSKPYWGGNDDHGAALAAAYLESLSRKMERPDYVILLHDAVEMAFDRHQAFSALRQLGDTGTSILVLQDSINSKNSENETMALGSCSSMDEIVSVMTKVDQVMMF